MKLRAILIHKCANDIQANSELRQTITMPKTTTTMMTTTKECIVRSVKTLPAYWFITIFAYFANKLSISVRASCTVLMPRRQTEEDAKHNAKMRVLIRQIRAENNTRPYLFGMDAVLTSLLRAFSMSSKKCKIYKPFVANKKLHTNFNLVGVFVAFGCVPHHTLPLIHHSVSLFLPLWPLFGVFRSFIRCLFCTVHFFIPCIFIVFVTKWCLLIA